MLLVILLLTVGLGYGLVGALRQPDDPWQTREFFWALLIGIALTSWLGQLLADAGWYSWWRIAGILVALNLGLLAWLRERLLPRGLSLQWREIGALGAILLVGSTLFFQSGEITIGGRDDGIRLLAGITVARHGGWLQETSQGNDLPRYRGPDNELKYLGFLLADAERGLVVPQFTGIHEVWQAIAYGWREQDTSAAVNLHTAHPWMFRLNPIMALLSLIACYMLGRAVLNHWAAIIGTGLLSISLAQVWYARLAMAEILFQFFLLGGVAASVAYARRPQRTTALAAGLAFGVALLTKVDGVIALAVLVAVGVLMWPQRRRWLHGGWLVAPLVLLILHYGIHSRLFSGAYFSSNTGSLFRNPTLFITGGLGLCGLALFIALRLRYRERFDALVTRSWSARWRVVLLLMIGAAAVYAYFIRPSVLAGEGYIHPVWNERIESNRGLNFVLLVAYLTPLGAGLALVGLAYWLLRTVRWQHLPFLALLLGYTIVFTYNAFIVGDQPFWVRRFLPAVIPGALLLAGGMLVELWRAAPRWRWSAPLLLASLIGWLGWQTAPIALARTGTGLGAQVQTFAAQFPPNAVVLFQDWRTGFALAAPLEIGYGREVYQLNGETMIGESAAQWQAQMQRWQQADRPLFYVAQNTTLTLPHDGLIWQQQAPFELSYATLETTHAHIPRTIIQIAQTLQVYQLLPDVARTYPCAVSVDIGSSGYGVVGSGFYEAEQTGDQVVQWTDATSNMPLPRLAGSGDMFVTVTLADLRPSVTPTATIQFSLPNHLLAEQILKPNWNDYQIRIPSDLIPADSSLILGMHVPPWSPATANDNRELGVLVNTLTARRERCSP